MVKKGLNKVSALVSGLLISIIVPAQELPLLPSDPAVKTEVFPDGMTCYVAANPYVKGFADYAVVRGSDAEVVFREKNVLTVNPIQVDSMLLSLISAVADSGTPADYAVIACGDLDAPEVLKKLKYMSLMVPAGAIPEKLKCESGQQGMVTFRECTDTLSGLSAIIAEWTSPRTPGHLMNTVQKAVYDKAAFELGHIACDRVRNRLKRLNIAAPEVSMNHNGSLDGPGDEVFTLKVVTDPQYAPVVIDVVRETLGGIDMHGAYASELRLAEDAYLSELSMLAEDRSNAAYVDRCISSYIYGSSLISPEGLIAFHRSKDISDALRVSVFSGISSALIDIEPGDYPEPADRYADLSDTLSLPGMSDRTLLRGFRKDPVSGGTVWTYANGFKVVYKKMPTAGKIHYSLAVNGGYGTLEGVEPEGYLSRYLDGCHISGMKPEYFRNMLQLAGMTMDATLNFSNIIVRGEVEDHNVDLMMKALLAIANRRSADDPLIDEMASRTNDGVLVIVSDMEESRLRRQLSSYVGGFRTNEKTLRNMRVSGVGIDDFRMSCHPDDALVAENSVRLPLTLENCAAADIAAVVLEYELVRMLAPLGLSADVSHTLRIYPEDRYNVLMEIRREDGGKIDAELMLAVRSVLKDVAEKEVSPELLSAAKAYAKNAKALAREHPSYWLHAIALRYLDGKDFTTGYEAKADAVTAAKVASLLSLLEF